MTTAATGPSHPITRAHLAVGEGEGVCDLVIGLGYDRGRKCSQLVLKLHGEGFSKAGHEPACGLVEALALAEGRGGIRPVCGSEGDAAEGAGALACVR